MIDARTLPINETTYTHVGDDGVNTHIASERLRKWCLENSPEIFLTPVNMAVAKTFITNNVVSWERVCSMKSNGEPILYCKDGFFTGGNPDVFLVDGHHRYARAAALREPFIEAWVLDLEQWKPFQLCNVPDTTQDKLRKAPVVRKPWW